MTVISLAVVTNNRLIWHGVQRALDATPHICLVGHAIGEMATDRLLGRTHPTIILLDLESYPDATWIIRTIRARAPHAKILGLGGVGTEDRMHDLRSWLDGVVLTVQPPTVMIRMIESLWEAPRQEVARRTCESVMPSGTVEAPSTGSTAGGAKELDALTARERQVTTLVGRGLANKDIADHLCVSEITVRHHLTRIYGKLGVTGRQNLLIHAHQAGFLDWECAE